VERLVLGETQAAGDAARPDGRQRGASSGEREAMGGRSRRGETGS
jgi:hypothetical protein